MRSSGEPGKVLSLELTVVTEVKSSRSIDHEIAHIIERRKESSEERGLQVFVSDQTQRGQGRRVEDVPDPTSMRAEVPFRRGARQITTKSYMEVLKFEGTLGPVGEAEVGVASTKDSSALRRRTSPTWLPLIPSLCWRIVGGEPCGRGRIKSTLTARVLS